MLFMNSIWAHVAHSLTRAQYIPPAWILCGSSLHPQAGFLLLPLSHFLVHRKYIVSELFSQLASCPRVQSLLRFVLFLSLGN